jgi:uncharacterized protein YmfQ (DUF2313 family)
MLATLLTQYNLDGSFVPSVALPYSDPTALEAAHRIFADHLPRGRHWDAYHVTGTPNHAVASAIGAMYAAVLAYFAYIKTEFDPRTTTDLIETWEQSVGLPDACIVNRVLTLQERRDLVMLRLQNSPIVTAQQIQDLVYFLSGYNAVVMPRSNPLNPFYDDGRFEIDVFVDFDNTADFDGSALFNDTSIFDGLAPPTIVECIINRIKPCNVIANVYYSADLYTSAGGA